MRGEVPMKRISVRLTTEERIALEDECHRSGKSISEVVREAIKWKIES